MGILSLVLRIVISCVRDEYGAVEKTLIIHTLTIYNGVKRVRSRRKCCSRHAFSQRNPRHQSTMMWDVHIREESFANVVLSSGTNMVPAILLSA